MDRATAAVDEALAAHAIAETLVDAARRQASSAERNFADTKAAMVAQIVATTRRQGCPMPPSPVDAWGMVQAAQFAAEAASAALDVCKGALDQAKDGERDAARELRSSVAAALAEQD